MTISDKAEWQAVFAKQRLANAKRWISLLESSENPAALINADYDNLLRALETTLQSPDTFKLAYQLIQSLYSIAFGYADWDRWLTYLHRTLDMSQQLGYQYEEARLLEQMGDLLYHTGNLKKAEEFYQQASQIYGYLDHLSYQSRVVAMLASIRDLQGSATEGIELCKSALQIAEESGDKLAIASANLNLSHILHRLRRWNASLSPARKAYIIYKQFNQPKAITKALLTLIAVQAKLGQWHEVKILSEELMDLLSTSEDIHILSQLKNNLGVVAFSQGKYKMAESAWQEALRLHSQIQEPTELASLYNNLGMVYTKLHEGDIAEEMLKKAVAAYRLLGDTYNWANSLDNLADLYEIQGKTAVCQGVLQEAIDGLQAIKASPHAQKLQKNMEKRLLQLQN